MWAEGKQKFEFLFKDQGKWLRVLSYGINLPF